MPFKNLTIFYSKWSLLAKFFFFYIYILKNESLAWQSLEDSSSEHTAVLSRSKDAKKDKADISESFLIHGSKESILKKSKT